MRTETGFSYLIVIFIVNFITDIVKVGAKHQSINQSIIIDMTESLEE